MDNIFEEDTAVSSLERQEHNQHKGAVLWFTGLSGSGKSTLARYLHKRLFSEGKQTFMLDGDNIRLGLNKDLSFTEDDRFENIRRISEVARLFCNSGMITLCSFISPNESMRKMAKEINSNNFFEIYVKCSLSTCEKRDKKGLYAKARRKEIKNFTGVSAPYELPKNPDLVLDTEQKSIEELVESTYQLLHLKKIIK